MPGLQVPRVLQRLTTFAARFETSTQLGDAEAVLRQHLAAQAELRASPCFAAALQLALAIGNFMNWGTRLGQAAGFRLKKAAGQTLSGPSQLTVGCSSWLQPLAHCSNSLCTPQLPTDS